jgi:chemotaxis protein methyltransferase WspC
MSLAGVETVVRTRLGIDPEALGAAALPRAVERRMSATGTATSDDYLALARFDPAEQLALAAELAVPETWFFRGGHPLFDALARFISARSILRGTGNPVRVLSVPCSTGEEPYSLAIALHDQHVPADAYRIEGVDLSAVHLARARTGRFTSFAFRESGADFQAKYFQHTGDMWELRPSIREGIRFEVGNAADPGFLAGAERFDLILCRNLFIYLTEKARRCALANLERLLVADGWLVLSPAEADRLPPGRFVATGPPGLGIYQRGALPGPVAQQVKPSRPPARKPISLRQAVMRQPSASNEGAAPPARPDPIAAPETLETARELADAGQLTAARSLCERLLAQAAGDAGIHALLGVVDLAEGRAAEAAESFRKALYLDPNHPDALTHMIVICDNRGDSVQAAALRKRLARAVREEPA